MLEFSRCSQKLQDAFLVTSDYSKQLSCSSFKTQKSVNLQFFANFKNCHKQWKILTLFGFATPSSHISSWRWNHCLPCDVGHFSIAVSVFSLCLDLISDENPVQKGPKVEFDAITALQLHKTYDLRVYTMPLQFSVRRYP